MLVPLLSTVLLGLQPSAVRPRLGCAVSSRVGAIAAVAAAHHFTQVGPEVGAAKSKIEAILTQRVALIKKLHQKAPTSQGAQAKIKDPSLGWITAVESIEVDVHRLDRKLVTMGVKVDINSLTWSRPLRDMETMRKMNREKRAAGKARQKKRRAVAARVFAAAKQETSTAFGAAEAAAWAEEKTRAEAAAGQETVAVAQRVRAGAEAKAAAAACQAEVECLVEVAYQSPSAQVASSPASTASDKDNAAPAVIAVAAVAFAAGVAGWVATTQSGL